METHKPKLSVGFFFLNLGLLITLITSVVSFLNLVFGTLDKKFPDVLNATYQYGYNSYDYEGIRIALSTLIIFFPIFVVISYFWRNFLKGEIGHYNEIIKRWVKYIILFLCSVVMVIDLVTIVRYFVSGEITSRFIYKVLSVFLVAVLVGAYYIILIKVPKKSHDKISILFALAGIVLVTASVWYSFAVMGSPAKQRLLRMDDRRVSNLQNIQWQIISYWQQKEKLPEQLSMLSNPIAQYSLPMDPEFEKGSGYEYSVKDKNKLSFELCATFALPMPKGWRENAGYYGYGDPVAVGDRSIPAQDIPIPAGANESWDHQAGKTCFDRTIDKDIYPPFKDINDLNAKIH